MKKLPLFFLVILFIASCTNSPQNIPFPEGENEFAPPVVKKLGKPEIIKVKPLVIPLGEGRPDSIKPPEIVKLGKPKIVPFITNEKPLGKPDIVPFKQPDTVYYFNEASKIALQKKHLGKTLVKVVEPETKRIKPKIVMLGQPDKVTCKPAQTADNAIANLKFYSQDQGLVATIVQCMCYDQKGNLWLGTDGGLCKFDGKEWWMYTVKQGLSNNLVYCLLESREGNLLIGTLGGGLNLLDAKSQSIKQYGMAQGLSNNHVKSLLESSKGYLLIGTEGGGLNVLDASALLSKSDKSQSLTHYSNTQGLSNNYVLSLLESSDGNLLIGTYGGGLNVLDAKSQSLIHYSVSQGLSNNYVLSLLESREGDLLIGTYGGGLNILDAKSQSLTHYSTAQGLSNNVVLSLLESREGDLLIGTDGGGLNIMGPSALLSTSDKSQSLKHYSMAQGLSNNLVLSLLESREGDLLIGTYGGGLNILDAKSQSLTHYSSAQGLSNNYVLSLLESREADILIGTSGGGLNLVDSKYQNITHYSTAQGLSNNHVKSLLKSREGKIIIGTYGGGLNILNDKSQSLTHYSTAQGLSSNLVYSLLENRKGNLLIGTYGGGLNVVDSKCQSLTKYSTEQGLCNNYILTLFESREGNLLIGTDGGGLNVLDAKSQSLKHYSTAQGLSNNLVYSLLENSEGNLLIGTYGGGLNILNAKSQSLTHYSTAQGLPNDQILSIKEDRLGTIWLGTGKGLCKMVKKNGSYIVQKNFDKREGLKYMDFNPNAMCLTKKGKLWAGIGDILTEFNPYGFIDTISPYAYITSIDIMEKKEDWFTQKRILENLNTKDTVWSAAQDTFYVNDNLPLDTSYFEKNKISYTGVTEDIYHLPKELVLPIKQNHLMFHFTGICIAANSDRIRYRYIMDGLDEKWSPITEKSEADYRNIPPGNYIFKVAARSVNGYWSKPIEFAFEVLPPWYKTYWAYGGYSIFLLSLVFGYSNWRTRALKQKQKELKQKVEEATSEIKEQKYLIEEKHKEITDSINYAERIQRSFLATKLHLDNNLSEYFVMFKPKDVVSGDFYWSATLNNGNFILATADSTGHGVPGAIMSLLNVTSLEKAIENVNEPSEILNVTRNIIIERLKKDGSAEGGKDGMDCTICVYDFNNNQLQMALANNPVWIIRGEEVIEIKPDKMPVGKHDKQDIPFTTQNIEIQKGDVIYTLTDGFPDQFGGEKGKKFMSKNLRELLSKNAHLPMQEQKQLLEKTFKNWVGDLEQVDDVTVIGVRI